MFRLRRPSPADSLAWLDSVRDRPFSYPHVGASRGDFPPGYDHDARRARLGTGDDAFRKACDAVRRWVMFPQPWTRIDPENAPIKVGQVVAVTARAFGVWWLNASKIIYVIDEPEPVRRFGFAYGTLDAHVESGEEWFGVEMHPDGSVWYDLRAFSRPRFWMTRLGYPLARGLQKRFGEQSAAAMARAAGGAS